MTLLFGKKKIDCVAGIVIQILKLLKLYLKEPCSENLFLKHASTFVFTTCIHVENISQNT